MTAITADDISLTASATKWSLGLRLVLSMVAAGLLCVAVLWRVAFPEEQYLADLVADGAVRDVQFLSGQRVATLPGCGLDRP